MSNKEQALKINQYGHQIPHYLHPSIVAQQQLQGPNTPFYKNMHPQYQNQHSQQSNPSKNNPMKGQSISSQQHFLSMDSSDFKSTSSNIKPTNMHQKAPLLKPNNLNQTTTAPKIPHPIQKQQSMSFQNAQQHHQNLNKSQSQSQSQLMISMNMKTPSNIESSQFASKSYPKVQFHPSYFLLSQFPQMLPKDQIYLPVINRLQNYDTRYCFHYLYIHLKFLLIQTDSQFWKYLAHLHTIATNGLSDEQVRDGYKLRLALESCLSNFTIKQFNKCVNLQELKSNSTAASKRIYKYENIFNSQSFKVYDRLFSSVLQFFQRIVKTRHPYEINVVVSSWYLDTIKVMQLAIIYGGKQPARMKELVRNMFALQQKLYTRDFVHFVKGLHEYVDGSATTTKTEKNNDNQSVGLLEMLGKKLRAVNQKNKGKSNFHNAEKYYGQQLFSICSDCLKLFMYVTNVFKFFPSRQKLILMSNTEFVRVLIKVAIRVVYNLRGDKGQKRRWKVSQKIRSMVREMEFLLIEKIGQMLRFMFLNAKNALEQHVVEDDSDEDDDEDSNDDDNDNDQHKDKQQQQKTKQKTIQQIREQRVILEFYKKLIAGLVNRRKDVEKDRWIVSGVMGDSVVGQGKLSDVDTGVNNSGQRHYSHSSAYRPPQQNINKKQSVSQQEYGRVILDHLLRKQLKKQHNQRYLQQPYFYSEKLMRCFGGKRRKRRENQMEYQQLGEYSKESQKKGKDNDSNGQQSISSSSSSKSNDNSNNDNSNQNDNNQPAQNINNNTNNRQHSFYKYLLLLQEFQQQTKHQYKQQQQLRSRFRRVQMTLRQLHSLREFIMREERRRYQEIMKTLNHGVYNSDREYHDEPNEKEEVELEWQQRVLNEQQFTRFTENDFTTFTENDFDSGSVLIEFNAVGGSRKSGGDGSGVNGCGSSNRRGGEGYGNDRSRLSLSHSQYQQWSVVMHSNNNNTELDAEAVNNSLTNRNTHVWDSGKSGSSIDNNKNNKQNKKRKNFMGESSSSQSQLSAEEILDDQLELNCIITNPLFPPGEMTVMNNTNNKSKVTTGLNASHNVHVNPPLLLSMTNNNKNTNNNNKTIFKPHQMLGKLTQSMIKQELQYYEKIKNINWHEISKISTKHEHRSNNNNSNSNHNYQQHRIGNESVNNISLQEKMDLNRLKEMIKVQDIGLSFDMVLGGQSDYGEDDDEYSQQDDEGHKRDRRNKDDMMGWNNSEHFSYFYYNQWRHEQTRHKKKSFMADYSWSRVNDQSSVNSNNMHSESQQQLQMKHSKMTKKC